MTKEDLNIIKKEIRRLLPKARYTLPEAALQLKISRNRIWKDKIATGELKVYEDDGQFWVSHEALVDYNRRKEEGK